ncbi:hypothetical protein TNCV_1833891 [Trichonephila clavipes]|nr:hypothetical protein TNCV_1833891 [Trichonephila clavipes]
MSESYIQDILFVCREANTSIQWRKGEHYGPPQSQLEVAPTGPKLCHIGTQCRGRLMGRTPLIELETQTPLPN